MSYTDFLSKERLLVVASYLSKRKNNRVLGKEERQSIQCHLIQKTKSAKSPLKAPLLPS